MKGWRIKLAKWLLPLVLRNAIDSLMWRKQEIWFNGDVWVYVPKKVYISGGLDAYVENARQEKERERQAQVKIWERQLDLLNQQFKRTQQ